MNKLIRTNQDRFPTLFGDSLFTFFDDFERDWQNFFSRTPLLERVEKSSYPKVDIVEEKDRVLIEASVPGLTKDQVKITYDNDTLTIKADSLNKTSKEEKNYVYKELHKSSFSRSFLVPEAEYETNKISATVENGLLKIEVLRKQVLPEKKQPKQITIS